MARSSGSGFLLLLSRYPTRFEKLSSRLPLTPGNSRSNSALSIWLVQTNCTASPSNSPKYRIFAIAPYPLIHSHKPYHTHICTRKRLFRCALVRDPQHLTSYYIQLTQGGSLGKRYIYVEGKVLRYAFQRVPRVPTNHGVLFPRAGTGYRPKR